MIEKSDKIRDILDEAEKRLFRLIGECAKSGDFAGIDAARDVAGRLRLIGEGRESSKKLPGSGNRNASKKQSRSRRRATKPSKLPRFEIRGTTLCRIGWSKKNKGEYEHKVPQAAILEIVDSICCLADSAPGLFTSEEIIKKTNQRAAVSIPIYQVYVVTGWLRDQKLIEQMGREGYSTSDGFRNRFEGIWNRTDTSDS